MLYLLCLSLYLLYLLTASLKGLSINISFHYIFDELPYSCVLAVKCCYLI